MYKRIIFCVCFLVVFAPLLAQKYLSHKLKDNKLIVQTEIGSIVFERFMPHVFRFSVLATGSDTLSQSHSVVALPDLSEINVSEDSEFIEAHTGGFVLKYAKRSGLFSVSDSAKVLLANANFVIEGDVIALRFDYSPNESYSGTGARSTRVDRRGQVVEFYNNPHYGYALDASELNFSIPYIVSRSAVGILVDNPAKGYADFGKRNPRVVELGFMKSGFSTYLLSGADLASLATHYGKLTGFQPLPPLWALGNLVSRMAYKSELELRAVVDSMQHAGFPMDAVIIDLNWFGQFENGGKTNMGNLDWDRVYWPQAEKMIADFQKRNVKTVLITEPFFLKETSNYDLLDNLNLLATDKKGKSYVFDNFYFGKAGLIDIFKPAAQQWFWLQYKKHINTGVAGWWGDLGEPEIHPSDVLHLWGKAEMVHNIYAHYWSKTLADGYRTDFPKQRLFNLNRSGFAGSQRFSVFPWTGDVSRSWVGLQAQLPIMLSMSLSGMAYTHSDLGGFAGGVADPELYVRWLQMGVFSPIFRPHGSKIPSEPVMWDAHTQELSMKAIRLRYSLLPYIYTLAWKNATEGLPLVRPVWYDGTSGVDGLGIDDAFFFGADLLVAPIMKAQQHTRRVYLPRGNWYEFRGTAKFVGDSWVEVPVVEDQIPVFVRGGSFVPMLNRQIQSTATYDVSSLQLHYYLGSKGHVAYSLFDDDGVTEGTLKYRNYQLLNFEMDELPNELLFAMDRDGEFPGSTLVHEMELVVHGVSSPPTEVRYGDKLLAKEPYLKRFGNAQYAWCYDEISASLFIRFVYLGVGKQTVRIVR